MHVPPRPEFAPWAAARFQTEEARDRFLSVVTDQKTSKAEVAPMPDDSRAALVRWCPGYFLNLNDIAYSQGGRIIITVSNTGYERSMSTVPARRSSRFLNSLTSHRA